MNIAKNKQSGFSSSEFLIVIAIIIVLAAVSIFALNGQRSKARDAKRISDIRQIRTALEFYYSDEGEYPVILEPLILGQDQAVKLCSKAEGGFVGAEVSCSQETVYMSLIPKEVLPGKNFTYQGIEQGYDIKFELERDSVLGQAGIYHAHSEIIDTSPGNR